MRMTTAGLTMVLAASLGTAAISQTQKNDQDKDRDAGKRETVRGVIAAVTIEGETAVDYSTHRAQTVEMSFLTVVGSPKDSMSRATDDKSKPGAQPRAEGRRRHNVYVVWLTPKTEVRDATGTHDNKAGGEAVKTTLDKIEVGDQVEVTFNRREHSASAGGNQHAEWGRRHGRHRTHFGDAVSLTILSEPSAAHETTTKDKNRDDDKDKVKNP